MIKQSSGLRLVALLAIAVVGVALALGLSRRNNKSRLPAASPYWYTALAAPYLPSTRPVRSACHVLIGPRTKGVAHPTLPCGVKIYVQFQGKQVLTQIIDRGPNVPGRTFDVTRALAKELGLVGTRTIKWRYTTSSDS